MSINTPRIHQFSPAFESHVTWRAEDPYDDAGLYIVDSLDSAVELVEKMDRSALRIAAGSADSVVAYIRVDPLFGLGGDEWTLVVDYLDEGTGGMVVEYSSRFTPAHRAQEYARAPIVWFGDSRRWLRSSFVLDEPRFTRACNLGDLRLLGTDDTNELYVRALSLYKRHRASGGTTEHCDRTLSPSKLPDGASVGQETEVEDNTSKCDIRTSIIIPTYNHYRYTRLCLAKLVETVDESVEIIVVDNDSGDGTADRVMEFGNLRVIRNPKNLGFAAACNIGAAHARGQILVFLNNDTIPLAGWLGAMLEACDADQRVGIVGARLLYPQTKEIQHAGISFDRSQRAYHRYRLCAAHTANANGLKKVRAVTGACMLVKRRVFELSGGFDETFRNGMEDVDLCLRILDLGYKTVYCPASVLYHFESATVGRLDRDTEKRNVRSFNRRWKLLLRSQTPDPPEFHDHRPRLPLRFDGLTLKRGTGSLIGTSIECRIGRDEPGHCVFGPDLYVGECTTLHIRFVLEIGTPLDADGDLFSLDVYDNWTDSILYCRTFGSSALTTDEATHFDVTIETTELQVLEFRVYWHGNCRLRFHRLVVDRVISGLEAASV